MNSEQQKLNDEQLLAMWVTQKFNDSRSAKAPKEKLDKDCIDAYNGKNLAESKPEYASNHVSNYIFSTLETIRPIMTDNNPKFIALPRTELGKEISRKIQLALDYEWDREQVSTKLTKSILTSLQTGTSIVYLPWDKTDNKGKGNVKWINVNPLSIYPDPMATSFDDAEYVIYATYKNVNTVKSLFPQFASKITGADVDIPEIVNMLPAQPVHNQVLILEMWCKDYTYVDVEEEIDGVKTIKKKRRFPNGRVLTVAPRFGLILSDKSNPYRDGKFPFIAIKDYDIPFEFWGKGEVEQLLSPQKTMNELNNAIIDNAKHTANTIWIVDKNSGIPYGGLMNRPGLVVRKNPGSEVQRPQPPSIPSYVQQKLEEMKYDMQLIAGVNEVTMGMSSGGVTAATAIMALQEAGQARIRLKVRLMEQALSQVASMWYSRMQQFWTDDREIRIADVNGKVDYQSVSKKDLEEDFDIVITAGSTMPVNKNNMLDMMIRLSQTPMEDGLPSVDREALMEYVPISGKQEMLERFEAMKQGQQQEQQNQVQQVVEAVQGQIEELSSVVQDLAKQVGVLSKEQETGKQVQKEKELFAKGMQRGREGAQLTDDEYYGIMQNSKKIPDEVLAEISQLSDEELAELGTMVPNLEQILAQNA